MKCFVFAALLGSTALIPAAGMAQTASPAQPQGAQAQSGQVKADQFVREAAVSGMFEVQSSQLAEQRAQDQQVKQFAQRMIQDHTRANDELKSVTGGAGQNLQIPNALDQEHAQKLQQLQQANGAQFDQLYAQMQQQGHQKAVGLFQSYAQNGDNPQLKQYAQKTLPVLQQHQQMAQGLNPGGVAATGAGQSSQTQTAQAGQDGSRITVQQPAPAVRVEQAAPQVTVQQPQPNVTVRQPQPEILVRMAPPTITVQQPQPEIIVRMPQPDVNVSMPQPQVSVNQPQPQVQVVPQEQPKVEVQRAQPQVAVQQQPGQTGQQANVQVEQAQQQPQIRFERTGEPNIQYNMTGEPKVTYENMQDGQRAAGAQATDQQRAATASPQPQPAPQTEADRRPADQPRTAATTTTGPAEQRARQGGADTTGAIAPGAATTTAGQGQRQAIQVSRLERMNVYNERGEKMGDVENVVAGNDNKPLLVIGHGGFLGLGEKRITLPVDQVALQGDRLVVRGLSNDQIHAMPAWDRNNKNFRELKNDQTAEVTVIR